MKLSSSHLSPLTLIICGFNFSIIHSQYIITCFNPFIQSLLVKEPLQYVCTIYFYYQALAFKLHIKLPFQIKVSEYFVNEHQRTQIYLSASRQLKRSVVDDPKLPATTLHYSVLTFNKGKHSELNFCLNLCLYSHNPKWSLFFDQKSVCQIMCR